MAGLVFALAGVTVAPVPVSASEEQQGAQLLQRVQCGKVGCQQLSPGQFELIGEYVMGRMVGSTAAHEAMNVQMRSMMGRAGEMQAHSFMGQRFAGCASGPAPATFASMMGMMSEQASATAAMMGNGHGNGFGSGMMGRSGSRSIEETGWSDADTVMVVLIAVLLAAALGILVAWRPWRRASGGRHSNCSTSAMPAEKSTATNTPAAARRSGG